jgi:hypothetical protein
MANQSLPSFLSSGGTLSGSSSSKKLLFSLIGASDPELSTVELDGGGSLATTDVGAVPGPETPPATVKGVVVEGGGGKPGPPVKILFGGG